MSTYDRSLSPERRIYRALSARAQDLKPGESLSPPITPASKFNLTGDANPPFQYGRFSSPVWQETEAFLAELEAAETIVFPSGMAACAAVLYSQLQAGDRIVMPSDGYYTVRVLIERFLQPLGVELHLHPTADYANAPLDGAAIVWIESPSNPGLDACDIAAVAAKAKAVGALSVADNTTATPLLQRPLDLGVDIVVSSDTKAAAGHSDVLFGHVSSRNPDLLQAARDWRRASGAIPAPFDAWLVHRGLQSLELRLDRMCANAEALAKAANGHPALLSLRFPGLAEDRAHDAVSRQMDRPGFLLGFEFKGQAEAEAFVDASRAIVLSTSFGGIHTTADRRAMWGDATSPGYLRVSAGCEPTEALVDDVVTALDAVAAA